MLNAQSTIYLDSIKYVVIPECKLQDRYWAYLEVTNVGDKSIQMNQFKTDSWGAGSTLVNGKTNERSYTLLPNYILHPGQSYNMTSMDDYNPKMFKKGLRDCFENMFPGNM
jgi:hypothetical protein